MEHYDNYRAKGVRVVSLSLTGTSRLLSCFVFTARHTCHYLYHKDTMQFVNVPLHRYLKMIQWVGRIIAKHSC